MVTRRRGAPKLFLAGFTGPDLNAGAISDLHKRLESGVLWVLVDPMSVLQLNKYCALLLLFSLPGSAADRVFSGSLERVIHGSISIRMADDLVVDAVLPAGIAVPYGAADQVEITCAPMKTVYDAQAGLHYHLLVKSLRLVRTATPRERAEVMALLSWQPGENLLYRPAPVAPQSPSEFERVRQVNLEYLSKMPNFMADETARRYQSDSAGKPWRLYDTIEDEITFKGAQLDRQNIRQNGKRFPSPFIQLGHQVWGGGFGVELRAVFDPTCPTRIDFAGAQTAGGNELLVYLFRSPAGGCFSTHAFGSLKNAYNPAVTGRILVDAGRGSVVRYEEEAAGFPEKFGKERGSSTASWGTVRIGDATYLLPVSAEFVARRADGSAGKVSVEYKNHRHFETAASVTFGKDR